MLHGLAGLAAPNKLVALTVDHGLRAGSADEARRVKAHCRRLGICHETLVWEAEPPKAGLQAAARRARYRLLGSAAARLGLAAVLTAHTSDDQDETLEMRRSRSPSESAPGLAGISRATLFDGRLWVLRPLLDVTRAEIRAHLAHAGVDWIEDPSNRDLRFERVRVRAQLKDRPAAHGGQDSEAIAGARSRLAESAAAFIGARCRAGEDETIRMRCSPGDDAEVVAAVIAALIDLCGGAAQPLDRRGKATLAALAKDCIKGPDTSHRAVTLGRALLRHRGRDLLIRRESRGLETLDVAPGAVADWDGRYRVQNLDAKARLTVSAGGCDGVSPSFGRDLHPETVWSNTQQVIGGFRSRRLLGRSSAILPVCELPLAQSLARLVQTGGPPPCPWDTPKGELASAKADVL
ncbi:tRNA lysidine(34) synthetase TilS [Hoeflea sp. J2-29]|uniref:tRNA(Ile)-lysidine synthase n=1 Tax=Hoeflea ulvae TaxID=2983764 RepID=A0ABT3YKZ8_9HYPH|nr:tRNA lysidine(34) synthetase TilS [Hoeflea ulvae]